MTEPSRTPDPRAPKHRVHMGTATSDPDYLPPVTPLDAKGQASANEAAGAPDMPVQPSHAIRSGRYLSKPAGHRSIFTARRQRQKRRLILIVAVAAVALALAWFFLWR